MDRIDHLRGVMEGHAQRLHSTFAQTEFLHIIADIEPEQCVRGDYDRSAWTKIENFAFQRHQGVTWVQCAYTVPEQVEGISIEGTQLRVNADIMPFFHPVEIYVDGRLRLKENAWMDFKCPEVVLAQSARPGDRYEILLRFDLRDKSYWNLDFKLNVIPEVVEDVEFQLNSIVEELEHMSMHPAARGVWADACDALIAEANTGDFHRIVRGIEACRQTFAPLAGEIKRGSVYLVGHAHIDMNWFWSMEETIGIVGRDFDTMTKLMEEYPDFRFSQSQCATYDMAERHFPEVFARVQKYVRNGQWDVTASTWVEGDMNMASGESLVRHMLYSKRYCREKLGADPKIMWCPDTFGHAANTPQLLNQAGIKYYFQTRCGIGVNQTHKDNRSYTMDSHHVPVYWWKGLDGSRVLSVNNIYTRDIDTRGILRMSRRMRDGFGIDFAMHVYGTGDHGGGPTRRDLRRVRLLQSYPTMPTLKFATTEEFYARIEAENPASLPERSGEQNFIFDGCYTSHADIKLGNRLCENRLESVEKLATAVTLLTGASSPSFEEPWRLTLFNQFHDILDGCGVPDTYEFTQAEIEKVLAFAGEREKEALRALARNVRKDGSLGAPAVVFNPTSWPRRELVRMKNAEGFAGAVSADGSPLQAQRIGDEIHIDAGTIPPIGYALIYLQKQAACAPGAGIVETEKYYSIETNFYQIEIKKCSGQITTLFDKINNRYVVRKEVINWRLQNGMLNTLQIHNEEPTHYSSWTVGNITSVVSLVHATSQIISDGPLLKIIRFAHKWGESSIRQDIVIRTDSPRIDFVTDVDWNEHGYFDRDAPMLKASFSPDVQNASAVFDIPFGAVARPTKDNEYVGQKWIDISDDGYGFAVLNDCKYGHKVIGNRMELSLIRSSWHPDLKADVGKHRFTYSIYPHAGNWQHAKVAQQGYFLNQPLLADLAEAQTGEELLPESKHVLMLGCPHIVLSALKPAEGGSGYVARLFNHSDQAIETTLTLGFDADRVQATDLLEQPTHEVELMGGSFVAAFRPFEIKTYLIDAR